MLCDVDHLKVLNDTGGHEAGDAALRRAADVLRELAGRCRARWWRASAATSSAS